MEEDLNVSLANINIDLFSQFCWFLFDNVNTPI